MESTKKDDSNEQTNDEESAEKLVNHSISLFDESTPHQNFNSIIRNNDQTGSGSQNISWRQSILRPSKGPNESRIGFNREKNEESNWHRNNQLNKEQNDDPKTTDKDWRSTRMTRNDANTNFIRKSSHLNDSLTRTYQTRNTRQPENTQKTNELDWRRDSIEYQDGSEPNTGIRSKEQDWHHDKYSNRNETYFRRSERTSFRNDEQESGRRNFRIPIGNDTRPSYSNQQSELFSVSTEKSASRDVTRFWENLSRRVLHLKFELHIEEYSVWLETWKAAAGGVQGPVRILPIAYLRLPAITDIAPSPIVIINVLIKVVHSIKLNNQISRRPNHQQNDFSTANMLEAVLDIIKLRLINRVECSPIENIDSLIKAVSDLENILKPTITESMSFNLNDIERLARLILRQQTEMNELRRKIKEKASNQSQSHDYMQLENRKRPPWLGWQQNPTLDWLMSGSWHMVDGLKAVYESSEQYAETLLKLWTLLTFYWGSGAVWPRCSHKQGGDTTVSDVNVCGEPLLTATNIGSCKKCGSNASWKCFRRGHDHMCKKCLVRFQNYLVDSPGPQASTDIYDAEIEREVVRREETVYLLKNVKSRKPPKIATNWKTSYRLPISVLVAVIKLSVSGEPIQRSSSILWAEIVPYDIRSAATQDWTHRSNGCMAIRLLNNSNCFGLPEETETYLDYGVRVAIIDLRVFVPEVISILNTFSKKDFKDQLDQIPFFERLIGHGSTKKPLEFNPTDSTETQISFAVENSEIDYIQRLESSDKSKLIEDICALKPIQSLSGTQLEAFTASLYSSVHCTQGPPGTGKSYLGVCLVLALNLIRSIAESKGHAVGPILVLSYKNHALDEFLIDVISQYNSCSKLRRLELEPGMLIRTGKPDIESLERYTEKNSLNERSAKSNLERIISIQKNVRFVIKQLLECARGLETSLDLDISHLEILQNSDLNSSLNCCATKVVCLALKTYCIMNDYEKDNEYLLANEIDNTTSAKERKLTELNEFEMKAIFEDKAIEILEKLTSNVLSFKLNRLNQTILNLIVGLSSDLEHWKIPGNVPAIYFYVNAWLKGQNPPPRCQARINETLCREEAAENSSFCHLSHNCHSTNCKNFRISPGTPLCFQHICQFQDCTYERLEHLEFCYKHICAACVLTNSKEIKSRRPHACKDHECTLSNCNKLQMFPYQGFCTEHVCTECVVSSHKEKCFSRLNGTKLCEKHKCFVVNCKNKRLNESFRFCAYHVCRLCDSNKVLTGADLTCPQSQLCENHRCKQNMCFNSKFEYSSYCKNHSCKECFALKFPIINPAVDKMPRNSCKMHSLCQFISKNGNLCNKLAQKPTFYCNEHQELKKKNTFIKNIENMSCSCRNSKGNPCQANQTKKINNKWYCKDHAPPESEEEQSDSSEEEDAKAENNRKTNFFPVLKVNNPVNVLKKIQCNGFFRNDERCDLFIFVKDYPHRWLCPLHEHINQKSKPNEISKVEMEETIKPKTKPIIDQSSKEDKPIQIVNSELKSVEESLKLVLNSGNKKISSEEDVDFGEAIASNMNPDEMDIYYDDEEEQQNEELKRLQELTEITDYSDEEEKEEIIQTPANNNQTDATDYIFDANSWSWNLSHQDRLIAAAQLIRLTCSLCNRLNKIVTENDLHKARKTFSEAGAQTFRNARIIGATVVGASRRLEALRSAGPFAVVIEEACEVIEPTLMSVLSVNTLRKLEMIGDHRQLPAFVQQCWFNFETTLPSLKTSLFERLISGSFKPSHDQSAAAILSHTVLDEQRRMRSSIADITRPDYTDLVQILDHNHTAVQCIGDVVIRSCVDKKQVKNTEMHRSLWFNKGRSVPGLSENIYFWDLLNNSESRPIAGLSACNQGEAEAVASLTKWLLLCGCPPASISIITPYKGQKNAIIAALKKNECLLPYSPDGPPPRGTTLTISTVDRYQGDENDIVILSLVRCSPGNRFVGLQNRFVVAMSRARLGFFVIGSVNAVVKNRNEAEGPAHWRRFISSLRSKSGEKKERSADESRCGNELPICCPRHGNQVKLNVSKVSDFPFDEPWNKFCSLSCQAVLERCGHLCKLPCHSPVDVQHNIRCIEPLERPCELHASVALVCHELDIPFYYSRITVTKQKLANALRKFKCKEKVDYCRPECGHIVSIECFIKKQIDNGQNILNDCQKIVSDFIHPVCNHLFKKPKCATKRKYELKAPDCLQKLLHKRQCGCELEMACYESIKESTQPSVCNISVEIARPRCGHMLSIRCFEAGKLKEEWAKQSGKSRKIVLVMHDETYGPPESSFIPKIPQCQVPTAYMAPCGHIMTKIPCSVSFEFASGLKNSPQCTSLVEFLCPFCRHAVKNECWLSQSLNSVKIWNDDNVLSNTESGDICINEANLNSTTENFQLLTRIENILPELCHSTLTVQRVCSPNHTSLISCYQLYEILMKKKSLKPCNLKVDRILPCKHVISVECSKKNQHPAPICEAKIDNAFTYSCGMHETKPKKCCDLERLKETNPKCQTQITCSRYRCSHKVRIACFLKQSAEAFMSGCVLPAGQSTIHSDIDYCEPENDIPVCNELVNYKYKHCGHTISDIRCSEAFTWAANNELHRECTQAIEFKNPICGHPNKTLCFEANLMHSWNPWIGNEAAKPNLVEYVMNHDAQNKSIMAYSIDEKVFELKPPPKGVTKNSLICDVPYLLNRKCGHSFQTTCSAVYWQTYSPCQESITIECEKTDCKHHRSLACHVNETEKRTGKKSVCKNIVSRLCKKCTLNKVDTECSHIVIECNSLASITLQCNHEVTWNCGTDPDPREKPDSCQQCIIIKWNGFIKNEISVEQNQQLLTQIETKIDKFLSECAIISKSQKVPVPNDFYNHNECRHEILSRCVNSARNSSSNISAPITESLAGLEFYELVFIEVKKNFQINNDSFYFEQTDTKYGRGCELVQLNQSGLRNCKPDAHGLVNILVGAAFRFNIAPYSQPYLATVNKKANKAANRISTKKKQEGFDGIHGSSNESESKKIVFWEPGSCIQLKLLSLKICQECLVCLNYYTDEKGFSCSKKHFLCWECFEKYVNQAAEPDSVGKCVDDQGSLLCPECSEPITLLKAVKESIPQKVFDSLESLKAKTNIKKAVDQALKEQEARLRNEFERIQAIKDEDERKSERIRLEIIENILTLRCPRCKCAFIDYTGCAALTCSNCKASFCALCLKDCGTDAHPHVRNCPENKHKDLFIPEKEFNRHHSIRREQLINEKIKDQSNKTKRLLSQRMEKDFGDLGIQVNF